MEGQKEKLEMDEEKSTKAKPDLQETDSSVPLIKEAEYVQELIYEFHTLAFGLPMGNSGSIFGGLDGSTTRSRERLQSSLKDMIDESHLRFDELNLIRDHIFIEKKKSKEHTFALVVQFDDVIDVIV